MSPAMRGAVLGSIIFHAMVITFAIVGLPHLHKPRDMPEEAISVEVLDIAELRQTNTPPVKAPPPKEEPKEKPPEKKVEKPPQPPKVDVKEPPKAVPPKPPEPKKEKTKPPEPKVPPPPTEKLEEPKPPEPKKEDLKEEVQQQEDFASLLKNLQDSEPQVEDAPVNPKAETAPPQPSPLAQFSQRLTMSELDALRHQLSQCWSIQAGARFADDLIVEIRVRVNPDRTLSSATIVDMGRYNNDGFFRAAADSAMRAIRSPMCNPLNLPPDKYDIWKDTIIEFNPSEML